MRELPDAAGDRDAEALGRRVGALAGRLATFLERSALAHDEALAGGIVFLRAAEAAATDASVAADAPDGGDVHPIDRLAAAFGLAQVEVDLLLLAGMPEEHEGYASLLRALHPRGEARATIGLAAQLLCESARERRLLRSLLVDGEAVRCGALVPGNDATFYERSLHVADALWPALAGIPAWPAGVRPLTEHIASVGLEEWLASESVQRAVTALERGAPALIVVMGDDEPSAVHRAAAIARQAGVAAVTLEVTDAARGDALARLVTLHAVARGAVPIVSVPPAADGPVAEAPRFETAPGPVLLCAREGTLALRTSRPVITVRVERLTMAARERLWQSLLPDAHGDTAALAARYALEPHAAATVASDAREQARLSNRPADAGDVAASVRARVHVGITGGIRVVHPTARWETLILSDDRLRQLREALDRLRHQGRVLDDWRFLAGKAGARGVRMLFAGPSGTGKTLAAEVLAHTLGVDLLVVDLARVVSKWIGETERNLAAVFDDAERTQSVLLFDEADALFGKRTEVHDAHDRYANLETAYLLTRLERFEGLAILSTNLRANIDPAFTRRLEFVVDFDEPSLAERVAIWRCHLPDEAPLAADVQVEELASLYPVVGGLIRNAAVAAGFLASAADAPITRTDLVRAIRREYDKSGRAFPGAPAGTLTP